MAFAANAQERVENGSFDEDFVGWDAQIFDTSTVEWSALDAEDWELSGSIRFAEDGTVGPNSVRAGQCLLVVGGAVYDVAGSYYIPTQPVPGSATLSVLWHPSTNCEGSIVGDEPRELPSFPFDTWTRAEMPGLVAPAEANSLELLIGAAFADETGTFVAHWDDISVLPEPSGASQTVAALIAVAALARRCTRESPAAQAGE